MVAYQDFVALSQSGDSEERGQAAHLAAQAYLMHTGPADEHAALYAALIGFLDDPSVRVRAALAKAMGPVRKAHKLQLQAGPCYRPEVLEHKRLFDQAAAGNKNLIGTSLAINDHTGVVMGARWTGQ